MSDPSEQAIQDEQLPRLAPLADIDFTSQTNPRQATVADYERLFLQAM